MAVIGELKHAGVETYDEIALGVESAWPVSFPAELQAPAATLPQAEEAAFPSIPTTA
jgi:hypothetical protein